MQPCNRVIAAADKEQEQVRMRSDLACSKNAQGFAEAGRAFACKDPAQGILMDLSFARNVAARASAGLDGCQKQPGEVGADLLFSKECSISHRRFLISGSGRLTG